MKNYCLLLSSLVFIITDVFAAIIKVPSQYIAIKDAINAANTGDVIEVEEGIYYENFDITKNIKLTAVGRADSTIIDGSNEASVIRFINVKSTATDFPTLTGFTIRGGLSMEGQGGGITLFNTDAIIENNIVTQNESSVDGGGILVNNYSHVTIRNNEITDNHSSRFGGGIFIVGNSDPIIYGNIIRYNKSSGPAFTNGGASGGGIYVDQNASPQIIQNEISDNTADFAGGGIMLRKVAQPIIEDNIIQTNYSAYGGGIHIETEGGTPIISGNIISGNHANYNVMFSGSGFGGGISIYNQSQAKIIDNEIVDNVASDGGGGIVCSEQSISFISGNVIGSNITGQVNNYVSGGGLYVANATVTMRNNVIDGNKAKIGGGIALLDNAHAEIDYNTIVNNVARRDPAFPSGGGVFVHSLARNVRLSNNIITHNVGYQIAEEFSRALLWSNLLNNDDLGIYFNWDTNKVSSVDILNTSIFVDGMENLSGNESFRDYINGNYQIDSNSVAVDAGTPANTTGYDLMYQFHNVGLAPDIGAFEYAPNYSVTNPVYRFWSDLGKHHFYTISKDERNHVLNTYPQRLWRYEGVAYRAYPPEGCMINPVFRFWSDLYRGHFYTISKDERDLVIALYPDNEWRYEGEAFCASVIEFSETEALYRFWSSMLKGHFYTASNAEKDYVINSLANIWQYEGVAYYVYPNRED